MSKGPGKIAWLILSLIESDPDGAWLLSDICKRAYPGINRVDKKHRVAVARTLRTMKLPGTWRALTVKNEYCLCDICNLNSMFAARLVRALSPGCWGY